ncbi:hypothetical protein FRC01_009495 [Tulasnella sp. 417]|nr:hypothetical protein FRC01_009495 [Tulasnella sp. 417]
MFGKILAARSAAAYSPVPQFQPGPNTQSASRTPKVLIKKFLHLNYILHHPSSAKKDTNRQGTLQRQGPDAPEPSQSSQGPNVFTEDAESDQRPDLCSPVEPAQPSAPHILSSSPRSITSQIASSLVALSQSVAAAPAISFAHACSSFQLSTQSTAPRSTFSQKASSPIAPPQFPAAIPATAASSARSTSQPSRPSTAPHSPRSPKPSQLLVAPHPVAAVPANELAPIFSSFQPSTVGSDPSSTNQLIAKLEQIVAFLDWQHDQYLRGVHSTIEDQVFPHAKSLADEAESTKKQLKDVMEQIAAVNTDCSRLAASCKKFDEAEVFLKKAQRRLEETNKEHVGLQAKLRELQLGRAVNAVGVPHRSEARQRVYAPPRPPGRPERGASLAAPRSPQRVKKVIKSWDSQWEPLIDRYSEDEDNQQASDGGQTANVAAHDPSQRVKHDPRGEPSKNAPYAKQYQGPVTASKEPGRQIKDRRVHGAHQADPSGRPLHRDQRVPDFPVRASKK